MSFKVYKVDVGINFVDYISSQLKKLKENYQKIIFISANRRPIRFIEKSIDLDTILKIDFYTIEDFVKDVVINYSSDIPKFHTKLERSIFFLDLIKEIPELYEKLGNDDAKVFPWAIRVSNLFDEVDKQKLGDRLTNFYYTDALLEAEKILENLKDLYILYEKRYKNYTYNGDIFKRASFLTSNDNFLNDAKGKLFIFSGLIYLSNSEYEILKNIAQVTDIKFYLQTDLLEKEDKELGFDTFKVIDDLILNLSTKCDTKLEIEEVKNNKFETNFKFYQFIDTHSEALEISNIVKNTYSGKSPDKLAVILPDSKTLFPLLSYIDNKNFHINISMGYPFSYTDIGIFLDTLFLVLIDIDRRYKLTGDLIVDSKLLLKLLNSNLINIFNEEIAKNALELKEKIFREESPIFKFSGSELFYNLILAKFLKIENFGLLKEAFYNLFKNFDNDILQQEIYKFTTQILQYFYNKLVENLNLISANREIDLLFAYNLIKEIIKEMSIPFEGHPLEGIQIMGMLEARMLSFENLIIADVNEGVLPKGDKIDPLLPDEIKNELGLPSFKEKEMLMKYNFFRLVYSAKNVHIMYKSGYTGTEKFLRSRFVEQIILLNELKYKKPVHISTYQAPLPKFKKIDNKIQKDNEILEYLKKLFTKGNISPSKINYYMQCPYAFYLKNIKKIKGRINLEEEYEADNVGRIVHKFFEKNFENYKEKFVTINDLKNICFNIKEDINNLPQYNYKDENGNIKKFLNKLNNFKIEALKIILTYRIDMYFRSILKKEHQYNFKILELEKGLKSDTLNLYGLLDRIDELEDGTIRIIDYKTGLREKLPNIKKVRELVENKSNIMEEFNDKSLEEVRKCINSVQLPCYIIMAKECYGTKIIAELHLIGVSSDVIKGLNDDYLEYYREIIKYIQNHMKSSEYIYAIPSEHCKYCDYNYFCKYA